LVNEFIDHLHTSLGTASIYSTIAYIHTSQITTAPAKHFPAFYVFTSRSRQRLLTVEILKLRALTSSCHSCPCRTFVNSTIAPSLLSLPSRAQLTGPPNSLLYNSSARTVWTTPRFPCVIRNRCRGDLFTEPLPRNRSDITVHLTIVA
jgi:hypothetical protein